MPYSYLRVQGSKTKVSRFLRLSKLQAHPYESGDGFNVLLSSYDGKLLLTRIRLVAKFLRENRDELLQLKALGFQAPLVDFGLYDETPPGRMWPMYRVPAAFIQLIAEFGFELELSFYGRRDDDLTGLEAGAESADEEDA
jgi:hypothetical protein